MEQYDEAVAVPQTPGTPAPARVPLPFVEVAVQGRYGADRLATLTYAVPATLRGRIEVGQLIWAPLRQKLVLGVVTGAHGVAIGFEPRDLHAPVEPEFRLAPHQLALAAWIAERYCCTLFEAALPMLPPGASRRSVVHLAPTGAPPPLGGLSPRARRLLALLEERGETSLAAAQEALGSSLATVVPGLERLGLIERIARVVHDVPTPREERWVRLLDAGHAPFGVDGATAPDPTRAPRQAAVLDLLRRGARLAGGGARGEGRGAKEADDRASASHTSPSPLVKDGALPLGDLYRLTGADRQVLRPLEEKGLIEIFGAPGRAEPKALRPRRFEAAPPLTPEQLSVWEPLSAAIERRAFAPFLLHGVTGSGKTEIYLRGTAAAVRAGRRVLVLVPEIALASQIVARFVARFPGQVAVLHSALRDAERYAQWEAVRTGERPIVIGPRSALFAPAPNVGLIVIDEEHESAYKQEAPPPRYDARAVAEELARSCGATLVLGSATPDVATRYRAEAGEIGLLELRGRVGPARGGGPATLRLPDVAAVDLRQELRGGHTGIFSRPLIALLRETLAAGEQSILFLNRRGLATFVQCRPCGQVMACPRCDIPLVYHAPVGDGRARGEARRAKDEGLICHRCNGREPKPRTCPACGAGGGEISYFGVGTQRVEREVRALLPAARVLRWDQDALSARVDATALLAKVQAHEVDIVVGTQMVAKGLDLPLVTSIGVINADTLLNLPDFRAGERTFQMLTQVAGRAGRRGPGGRVIVQSYTPEHYAVGAALGHDYADFYREELDFRRRHRYPPFSRLARFVFRHADEAVCAGEGERLARGLALTAQAAGVEWVDIMGPTPCFAAKARDLYQWQLILRSDDAGLATILHEVRLPPSWQIDVDPLSLL